jgi:chromosomal replication initiation ATPase DnaA
MIARDKTDNPEAILTKEAIELFAERLTTPLQTTYYLTRALEKWHQIGERSISIETAKVVLSQELNSLEPNLARHGYNLPALCDYLTLGKMSQELT